MTSTDFLHDKIGEFRTGWVDGKPLRSANQLTCFCRPTKDLLRFTIFSDTETIIGSSIELLYASIEGLGFVSLIGSHVVKTGGAAKGSQKFQIDILPSLIIEGHVELEDIESVLRAQLTISADQAYMFSGPFENSGESISKTPNEFREIYSGDELVIEVGSYVSNSYNTNSRGQRTVSLTDQPAIKFRYSESTKLEKVRQDVILACQLFSAFYMGRLTCINERYMLGEGEFLKFLHDRYFHLNLYEIGSGFLQFESDASFSKYNGALWELFKISNRFPGISDLFWHSSVHAKSVSRVAIDSFLTAGRLAEEIYALMFENRITKEVHKGSSIADVLKIINAKRKFHWTGSWKNSLEIFKHYQDTRNLYAHGSTRERELVLYGFDINFLAYAIHIHLFAILGELLGFDRETMFAASRRELKVYHHHYLNRRVIGSPISNLTRKCEWKFA